MMGTGIKNREAHMKPKMGIKLHTFVGTVRYEDNVWNSANRLAIIQHMTAVKVLPGYIFVFIFLQKQAINMFRPLLG